MNKQTNKGEKTNVKSFKVIDMAPLDTVSRADDREAWNAMQLYGESDSDEQKNYSNVQQEPNELIKRINNTQFGAKILRILEAA